MAVMCNVCFVFLLFCLMPTDVHSVCCQKNTGISVNFPNKQDLMTMDKYNQHVLGEQLNEFYVGMPNPLLCAPIMDCATTVTKTDESNKYLVTSTGFENTRNNIRECKVFSKTVMHVPDSNKAFFEFTDKPTVLAYVTDCPELYTIAIRCGSYNSNENTCLKNSTVISVYVKNHEIRKAPIYNVTMIMNKVMGVEMGSEDFQWFYTFGTHCQY